jgi:hypothetical protein
MKESAWIIFAYTTSFFVYPKYASIKIIGYTTKAIQGNGIPKISEYGLRRTSEQEKLCVMSHAEETFVSKNFIIQAL